MYQWEFDFLEELNRIYQRQMLLNKNMKTFPEGRLEKRAVRNHIEFYLHTYKNGVRKAKYLSVEKDRELIEVLWNKAEKLPEIKAELKFTSSVIRRLVPVAREMLKYFSMPDQILPPIASQKQEYRNELTIKTNRGEMVRSKSEKIIADALYSLNLDYRYEAAIKLNGMTLYPDFTVINPLNGQTYYWEHLGLSTDKYLQDWAFKKRIYNENNIAESKNLIVTTEQHINQFDYIAAMAFSPERYKSFLKL